MEINQVAPGQFQDLFGSPEDNKSPIAKFGGFENRETDLFSTGDTTTVAPSTADSTTSTGDTTTIPQDADIFADDKGKPGRKPKYDFTDTKGYFEDRIKSGKFVAIEEEDAEGNKKSFIPSNPEEFDEVLDIQVNHRLDIERKDLEKKIYQSKSPAWQAILRYSEMTDDPAEVLPFIQGIKNIESVGGIDEKTPEGAEQIVRTRLLQRGEQEDIISEQVEALKGADKLLSTAAKYKPLILNEEKQNLQALNQRAEQEEREYQFLVNDIRNSAIAAIELPFGKTKLKQDEKAAIYDLIAEPNEETRGYGIYSVIDKLFETKNFDILRQVALLLTKKDSFISYISSGVADKTAEGLAKKLRAATDGRSSSNNDNPTDEQRQVVQRNQFQGPARFGRSQ